VLQVEVTTNNRARLAHRRAREGDNGEGFLRILQRVPLELWSNIDTSAPCASGRALEPLLGP